MAKCKHGLNPKQIKFCEIYCSASEFYGNGVHSYAEAYGLDKSKKNWYQNAVARASHLLTNNNILAYIDELLSADGYNDQFMDKQIKFLATQNADFGSKLGAIKEYNKLKQRITERIEQKVEVKGIDMSEWK